MSVFLFGCKDTTLHVAKFLRRKGVALHLVTISPENAAKNKVAGYEDLAQHSEWFESVYVAESYALNSQADQNYFNQNLPSGLGFCVGWQRLIPAYVLQKFSRGIHGMHGSARNLPFGKGRSPMNWAIIEGRNHFFTNLFRYVDGVDNGPIIDSAVFSITPTDTAETLHYKNTLCMCAMIERNLEALQNEKVVYREQSSEGGESFYPKREPEDGVIDWRDDIHAIDRLIRAVAPPFYGAIAYHQQQELRIFRASMFYTDLEAHPFLACAFGEVADVFPSGKFLVRCSGGVLIVHDCSEHHLKAGDRLDKSDPPLKRFIRNDYGFFDL